ncbi:hypothetical protein GE09DRAFT_1060347 [Coniochaeta sp. 2T2.1]|nr:hypothetical protein GE09DRAFT_1060347 [Coniochaeta sp. 2T2.1]
MQAEKCAEYWIKTGLFTTPSNIALVPRRTQAHKPQRYVMKEISLACPASTSLHLKEALIYEVMDHRKATKEFLSRRDGEYVYIANASREPQNGDQLLLPGLRPSLPQ